VCVGNAIRPLAKKRFNFIGSGHQLCDKNPRVVMLVDMTPRFLHISTVSLQYILNMVKSAKISHRHNDDEGHYKSRIHTHRKCAAQKNKAK